MNIECESSSILYSLVMITSKMNCNIIFFDREYKEVNLDGSKNAQSSL